jgi:hypothetical protein
MIGYSFAPSQDTNLRNRLNSQFLSPTAQQALQVLSLRLPTNLGGRPILPDQLLRPQIGGSAPPSAVVSSNTNVPAPPPMMTAPPAPSVSPAASPFSITGAPTETSRLASTVATALNGGGPSAPGFKFREDRPTVPTDTAVPTGSNPSPVPDIATLIGSLFGSGGVRDGFGGGRFGKEY